MLSDWTVACAYAAGIIDGEGWVGFSKDTRTLVKGNKVVYRYPVIEVAMTTHGAIDMLHKYFGGSVRYREHYARKRKPTWRWAIVNRQALAFIKAIRPYLHEKASPADAIIKYYEEKDGTYCTTSMAE